MVVSGRAVGSAASSLHRDRVDAESGSAIIEVVVLGLTLLLPLMYLLLAVFEVQRAAYATGTAVREAGRAFATAATEAEGRRRAEQASRLALRDQGVPSDAARLTITCPTRCLDPGGRIQVRSRVEVPLPWVPRILGDRLASVTVTAEQSAVVDRFRAAS